MFTGCMLEGSTEPEKGLMPSGLGSHVAIEKDYLCHALTLRKQHPACPSAPARCPKTTRGGGKVPSCSIATILWSAHKAAFPLRELLLCACSHISISSLLCTNETNCFSLKAHDKENTEYWSSDNNQTRRCASYVSMLHEWTLIVTCWLNAAE